MVVVDGKIYVGEYNKMYYVGTVEEYYDRKYIYVVE